MVLDHQVKWNEACVNMKTFTSPEALKADKIFSDLYGVLLWTIFIFLQCNIKLSYEVHVLYIVARIFENILEHARIFLDHD